MKLLIIQIFIALLIQITPAMAQSKFDLTFNLGPSLNQSGSVEDLGDPNLSTGFGFNYYFKPNHGIGFGYNNESSFDGTKKFPEVREASFSVFDLHYAYRYTKDKFQFVFEPGIGKQTLYDLGTDYYWGYAYSDDLSTALAFNYKLFARYILSDLNEGSANFFVGAGLIHNFTFDDDYNGRDISGNRLAMLFQLGLGF